MILQKEILPEIYTQYIKVDGKDKPPTRLPTAADTTRILSKHNTIPTAVEWLEQPGATLCFPCSHEGRGAMKPWWHFSLKPDGKIYADCDNHKFNQSRNLNQHWDLNPKKSRFTINELHFLGTLEDQRAAENPDDYPNYKTAAQRKKETKAAEKTTKAAAPKTKGLERAGSKASVRSETELSDSDVVSTPKRTTANATSTKRKSIASPEDAKKSAAKAAKTVANSEDDQDA